MSKFLTNFAKSVALAPAPSTTRRRSSAFSPVVDLPEAAEDAAFSEVRKQVKGKDTKEVIKREL